MRAKVCLKCKVYLIIHPDNAINLKQLQWFDTLHRTHPTQIINRNELNGQYTSVEKKDE